MAHRLTIIDFSRRARQRALSYLRSWRLVCIAGGQLIALTWLTSSTVDRFRDGFRSWSQMRDREEWTETTGTVLRSTFGPDPKVRVELEDGGLIDLPVPDDAVVPTDVDLLIDPKRVRAALADSPLPSPLFDLVAGAGLGVVAAVVAYSIVRAWRRQSFRPTRTMVKVAGVGVVVWAAAVVADQGVLALTHRVAAIAAPLMSTVGLLLIAALGAAGGVILTRWVTLHDGNVASTLQLRVEQLAGFADRLPAPGHAREDHHDGDRSDQTTLDDEPELS